MCGTLSIFLYVCCAWLFVAHCPSNISFHAVSLCYRKPLTRGGCSASVLPGSTQATRLFALGSSATKHSTTTCCITPSAQHAPRVMRQNTISNPEDLEATQVQAPPSCLKCSSYPQLTDSQLNILTREGSFPGRHKWWSKLRKKMKVFRISDFLINPHCMHCWENFTVILYDKCHYFLWVFSSFLPSVLFFFFYIYLSIYYPFI